MLFCFFFFSISCIYIIQFLYSLTLWWVAGDRETELLLHTSFILILKMREPMKAGLLKTFFHFAPCNVCLAFITRHTRVSSPLETNSNCFSKSYMLHSASLQSFNFMFVCLGHTFLSLFYLQNLSIVSHSSQVLCFSSAATLISLFPNLNLYIC